MFVVLLSMLALNTASADAPPPREMDTRIPKWGVGFVLGAGSRVLPDRSSPDGRAPRVELGCIEVHRSWPESWPDPGEPDRLDMQVDWLHGRLSESGSRRYRLPITTYATWVRPARSRWDRSLSTGLYTELGRDSMVIDEKLTYIPAGTLAWAGRVALERPRFWKKSTTLSTALEVSIGASFGTDPAHPLLSRHIRLGIERGWSWGVGKDKPR